MNNEMIERCIKASFDCWKEDKGKPNLTVDDLSSDECDFAVKHIKAIINAMREPTEKMINHGDFIDPSEVDYTKEIWKD